MEGGGWVGGRRGGQSLRRGEGLKVCRNSHLECFVFTSWLIRAFDFKRDNKLTDDFLKLNTNISSLQVLAAGEQRHVTAARFRSSTKDVVITVVQKETTIVHGVA